MGANANNQQESMRFFKLIAKAEKADPNGKKAIVEIVKNGNDYVQGGWFASLSGFVTHGEIKDFEFEGEKKKKIVLRLMDGHETCQLEFSPNFATFGLINAMIQADFSKEVEISAWINKEGYVGAGIRYAGFTENIPWTISLEDAPKGQKYTTPGGKEETDYTNVSNFWLSEFEKIARRCTRHNFNGLQAPAQAKQIEAPATTAGTSSGIEDAHVIDEDPFDPKTNDLPW